MSTNSGLTEARTVRLLPWTGAGGKPCYVPGDGAGHVSRVADDVEDIQLDMAGNCSATPPIRWPTTGPPGRRSAFSPAG